MCYHALNHHFLPKLFCSSSASAALSSIISTAQCRSCVMWHLLCLCRAITFISSHQQCLAPGSTSQVVLCTMRAALFSSLLLAGLLLMHCGLQVHCSEAAAIKRKVKPHHHVPVKDPQEQKAQSMLQEKPRRSHAQQLAPVAPLDPACVPKYVTDLVIPPPMPVAPPGGVLAEVSRAFLAGQYACSCRCKQTASLQSRHSPSYIARS